MAELVTAAHRKITPLRLTRACAVAAGSIPFQRLPVDQRTKADQAVLRMNSLASAARPIGVRLSYGQPSGAQCEINVSLTLSMRNASIDSPATLVTEQ